MRIRGTIPVFCWTGWRNPQKTSIKIVGVQPEIRTGYFSDTSLERYNCTSLLGGGLTFAKYKRGFSLIQDNDQTFSSKVKPTSFFAHTRHRIRKKRARNGDSKEKAKNINAAKVSLLWNRGNGQKPWLHLIQTPSSVQRHRDGLGCEHFLPASSQWSTVR